MKALLDPYFFSTPLPLEPRALKTSLEAHREQQNGEEALFSFLYENPKR